VSISDTLKKRAEKYGDYDDLSEMIQVLKQVMARSPKWNSLGYWHKESLEMICVKMGRILIGDANDPDSWRDIAGYATLVEDKIVSLNLNEVMMQPPSCELWQ
jgi:hypothetical protein